MKSSARTEHVRAKIAVCVCVLGQRWRHQCNGSGTRPSGVGGRLPINCKEAKNLCKGAKNGNYVLQSKGKDSISVCVQPRSRVIRCHVRVHTAPADAL